MQWKDLDGTTLHIERQIIKGGVEPQFALPKTRQTREMDLDEETVKALLVHKSAQAELKMKNRLRFKDHGLIFAREWEHDRASGALGTPITVMWMNRRLAQICKVANVKRLTVHGLRHTCATLSLAAGVQHKLVQDHLGHANIAITLNVYGHVIPSMRKEAADKRASFLRA